MEKPKRYKVTKEMCNRFLEDLDLKLYYVTIIDSDVECVPKICYKGL